MLNSHQRPSTNSLVEANAAIPSHLHPVSLRSTSSASSPRLTTASLLAEAQLRAIQINSPSNSVKKSSPPPPPTHSSSIINGSDSSLSDSDSNSSFTSSFVPYSPPGFLDHDVASLSIQSQYNYSHHLDQTDFIAGLQIDPSIYPSLSSIKTPQASHSHSHSIPNHLTDSIRLITCAEYVKIYNDYITSASCVDESVVFPWLHCSDIIGTSQANYFADSHRAHIPPRYRGLTIVSADPQLGPRLITNNRTSCISKTSCNPTTSLLNHHSLHPPPHPHSISVNNPSKNLSNSTIQHQLNHRTRTHSLGASSINSNNSLDSNLTTNSSIHDSLTSTSIATTPTSPSTSIVSFDGPEPKASLLCSSLSPDDFLERCPQTGQFIGSFALPKLPLSVNLRLFRQQPCRYASISDIVVYSESGLSDDTLALAQLIKSAQDETYRIRRGRNASVIQYNVYIVSEPFEVFEREFQSVVAVDGWGYRRNRIDFFEREREEMANLTKASEIAQNVWLGNSTDVPTPHDDTLSSSQTKIIQDRPCSIISHFVKDNKMGNPSFDICLEAHDQAIISSSLQFHSNQNYLNQIHQRKLSNHENHQIEVLHMEVPSTGQNCSSGIGRDKLINYFIELAIWIKKMTQVNNNQDGHENKKILIHCHDGYTETSLFALSYIMYDRACSLPEAYLYLQNQKNRSFFVYPADYLLLQQIETKIHHELQDQKRYPIHKNSIDESSNRSSFLRGRVPFGLSSTSNSKNLSCSRLSSTRQFPWFYDQRFDGHFPSRILPFVYLGNLNHASNALMLKALGITHVVSMGESALIPPGSNSKSISSSFSNTYHSNILNSLWHEYANGQIDVLDMKGVADDGIDSIRPHIDRAMSFIEQSRQSGGKVLVHCRVGVSRSATIVIGYVMKYLKMDLASAYLMVRSRRLNILIQPNLLFMWGLKRLESDLCKANQEEIISNHSTKASNQDSSQESNERKRKMLSWSYLSKEIAELNHRYLC
ncbi:hypothetical protein O181_060261 [Austropuccinia psidii MF-1]|uniref:Protein-tyrosine-phosphatase n=1 Tax=Austropuccinia psidii MF-1 TaxID=1389203 RepID=A0A9Q3EDT6_9BASI|nr:hypothetical protein [Austropuccinia psidii MF-1]